MIKPYILKKRAQVQTHQPLPVHYDGDEHEEHEDDDEHGGGDHGGHDGPVR